MGASKRGNHDGRQGARAVGGHVRLRRFGCKAQRARSLAGEAARLLTFRRTCGGRRHLDLPVEYGRLDLLSGLRWRMLRGC